MQPSFKLPSNDRHSELNCDACAVFEVWTRSFSIMLQADASFAFKEGKEVELLDVSRFFVRVDWGQL
jgi:hypothetical protein